MASNKTNIAEVKLWGRTIGAVHWDEERGLANFEYEPAFRESKIEVSPLRMPLSDQIYTFQGLPGETFRGLPGMLADSLPDDFGNALIDAWLSKQGRSAESFSPIERLCYIGARGMGALEYLPATGPSTTQSEKLNIEALTELASDILNKRNGIDGSLIPDDRENTLNEILRIGTSAGGARAKAIIAWNRKSNEVKSGQVVAGEGFSYWILKFDGVEGNQDRELLDPKDYGLIEYAYYEMAKEAGITMMESRLLKENNRNHFMTKRFDRTDDGRKIHMQSLGALQHFDYKKPGAYSYEQAFQTIKKLGMPNDVVEEQFRRMAFNIIARNQDDHVKNISFLMDQSGTWSLSPAYDVIYSFNPTGIWTGSHQMTLNGKRENFSIDDFKECAKSCSMKKGRAVDIVNEVQTATEKWNAFASDAGVSIDIITKIRNVHRLDMVS